MRAAVHVEDHRIFFRRIEIDRIDEAVVIVVLAVGALDRTGLDPAAGQQRARLGSPVKLRELLAVGRSPARGARHIERGPAVHEVFAVRRDLAHVPALLPGKPEFLAGLQVHAEEMVLHGRYFCRIIIDIAAALRQVGAVGIHVGQAAGCELPACGAEVVVLVAVPVVREIEELVRIRVEEHERFLRLHPAFVLLGQERPQAAAVRHVVDVQVDVLLCPVEDLDVDAVTPGAPGNVGQVAFLVEIVHLQPDRRALGYIVHAQGDLLGGHAVHRIADLPQGAGARGDVEQREERDAAFVFPVESDLAAVGRNEDAAADAEFVAADALPAHDAGIGVCRNGVLHPFRIFIVEVVSAGIGQRFRTLPARRDARLILRHDRLVAGPVPGRRLDHQAAAQHGFFHGHHPALFLSQGKLPGHQQGQQGKYDSFHTVKLPFFCPKARQTNGFVFFSVILLAIINDSYG